MIAEALTREVLTREASIADRIVEAWNRRGLHHGRLDRGDLIAEALMREPLIYCRGLYVGGTSISGYHLGGLGCRGLDIGGLGVGSLDITGVDH